MLEILKKQKELKEKRGALAKLKGDAEAFKKRAGELETALEEAQTEDEIKLVEEQIDALIEPDGADEAAISGLEEEISQLEAEIEELKSRSAAAVGSSESKNRKSEERKENTIMNKRYIFGSLSQERRRQILDTAEVKEFLERVRNFAGEKRGVTGAELNIPEVLLGVIRENVEKYSKLIGIVRLVRVSGKSRQNILGAIPEAVWTEAIANFNDASISFTQIEVDGFKVAAYIALPNSTLEDSEENLAADIVEALTQGIGLAIDKAILFGTGTRMPQGIATRLAQESQPSNWGSNAYTWVDLHTSNIKKYNASSATGTAFFAAIAEAFGIPNGDYSTTKEMTWIMNHKTHMALRAKALEVDSAGNIVSQLHNEMPFIGGKIIEESFMADNDILGGFFDLYILAERAGASIANSEHVKFLNDQTVFAGKARYDGKPVFGEGFVLFNIANTNPTTSTTFAADSANTDLVSLSALTIGATPVTLFPTFDKDTLNYAATVTAHANKITATALKSDASITIKNGDTSVTNGQNATFSAGENILTIEVTNGSAAKRTYTVVVTDATT